MKKTNRPFWASTDQGKQKKIKHRMDCGCMGCLLKEDEAIEQPKEISSGRVMEQILEGSRNALRFASKSRPLKCGESGMQPDAIQLNLKMRGIEVPLEIIQQWTVADQRAANIYAARLATKIPVNPLPKCLVPYVKQG